MLKRLLPAAFFVGITAPAWAQTQPAPHVAPFTVSKETTLIDKPLRPDGTVNYRQAVNDLMGKGITAENNAAPLILSVSMAVKLPGYAETFAALGVPPPVGDTPLLEDIYTYTSKRFPERLKTDEEQTNLFDLDTRLQRYPWTAAQQKDAAAWLADQKPALDIVERAMARPRYYLPCVARKDSHLLLDELPLGILPLQFCHILTDRAMLHAGEGRVADAIADLDEARRLTRLIDQEPVSIAHLSVLAGEAYSLLSAGSLAASGLSPRDLAGLRQEIEHLPEIPLDDDRRSIVEEMIDLDMVMSLIRGDAQPLLRLQALQFDDKVVIDEGDLSQVDWDIVLRAIVAQSEKDRKTPTKPLPDELKDIDAKIAEGATVGYPETILSPTDAGLPNVKTSVEAFLRMRKGESRADYSARMGKWFSAGNPSDARRLAMLNYRPRVARTVALTAVALAQYKLDHGQYPDSLNALVGVDVADAFSGKPLQYRREGDDFVLWSVGINQKGDGSAKQSDLIIRSHPPQ